MTITKEDLRTHAREQLLRMLKPNDTVYGIVRTVARSGMSRTIDFYCVDHDAERGERGGAMRYLSGYMGHLGIGQRTKDGSLRVNGCGMDMVFHCVYTLGAMLWPQGTDKPHGRRNGEPDSDGGYALKAETL